MKRRRSFSFFCFWVVVLSVLLYFWVRHRSNPLKRAHQAHNAEPPRARTALRAYRQAVEQGQPQALLPMARILHHGLPQGPEPIDPRPQAAVDMYLQAALWGDVREQAVARDMLQELAHTHPALHAPRPPRPQYVRPRDLRVRVVELEPTVHQQVQVQSDAQNVHDSTVVRSLRQAIHQLDIPSSTTNASEDIRATLQKEYNGNPRVQDAIKGLELMERNPIPLSSTDMTEVEVLGRVWKRIRDEGDKETRENMTTMLVERLAESGRVASCASGRMARVVDALSTFDPRVDIKPTWVLRKEMLDRASVLHKGYEETEEKPFVETLRQEFYKDYVSTGLASKHVIDAELAEWGSSL